MNGSVDVIVTFNATAPKNDSADIVHMECDLLNI